MEQSTTYHKVDIYLYEYMLAEAMAVVDGSYWSGDQDRVIQAVRAEFPDWGIGKCKQRAEGIMNEGKAKYYDSAVDWLRTARDIYLQHDRGAEWQAYLNGLLELHAREYKPVPMLRGYGKWVIGFERRRGHGRASPDKSWACPRCAWSC